MWRNERWVGWPNDHGARQEDVEVVLEICGVLGFERSVLDVCAEDSEFWGEDYWFW